MFSDQFAGMTDSEAHLRRFELEVTPLAPSPDAPPPPKRKSRGGLPEIKAPVVAEPAQDAPQSDPAAGAPTVATPSSPPIA